MFGCVYIFNKSATPAHQSSEAYLFILQTVLFIHKS